MACGSTEQENGCSTALRSTSETDTVAQLTCSVLNLFGLHVSLGYLLHPPLFHKCPKLPQELCLIMGVCCCTHKKQRDRNAIFFQAIPRQVVESTHQCLCDTEFATHSPVVTTFLAGLSSFFPTSTCRSLSPIVEKQDTKSLHHMGLMVAVTRATLRLHASMHLDCSMTPCHALLRRKALCY